MTEFAVRIRTQVADLPRYAPGRAAPGADKLSSNEMPEGPSAEVIEAAAHALSHLNRYPDLTAAPVRESLARRFAVDADQVCVGCGSSAILLAALMAVCDTGAEVIYPWRSFESYPIAIPASSGTPVPIPLDSTWAPDLYAMRQAVTERTRAIIVCTPNNPTGRALPYEDVRAFVDTIPQDVLIIVDEAYIDFVDDPTVSTAVPLIGDHPNVLVMRTFSKAHALAGARIGYALGHADMIAAIQALLVPFGVSQFAQAAAIASLDGDEDVHASVRKIRSERRRVVDGLRDAGFRVPDSQANFCFLIGEGAEFISRCAENSLIVRPFPEGVRVTFGTEEQNDRLLNAAYSVAECRLSSH